LRNFLGALVFAAVACSPQADPAPSDKTGVTSAGLTPFPCQVGAVLQSKCWTCHGAEKSYGAPMQLLYSEDVHAKTRDGQEEIYQRISKRIHDASSPMPMKGFPALTSAETSILDAWVAQGGPAGTGCGGPPQGGTGGTNGGSGAPPATSSGGTSQGGATGTGGISYGGAPPSYAGMTGTGGVVGPVAPMPLPEGGAPKSDPLDVPVEPNQSECDMIEFHARNDATNAKYTVPTGEQYYCFGFHKEWSGPVQGLAFYPNVDNKQVIHHWLLYKAVTPQVDGSVGACIGFHPDGELIAGWAPGAMPSFLPAHVGLDLGGGNYILEVHYNNPGPPTQDGSGVTVCKAKTNRPETATVSWLGTEAIILPPAQKGLQIVSNCRPNITDKPIHIIKVWPHMHKLGRHMRADIHRADGTTIDPLFNVDFSFDSQWGYNTPAILQAGDYVTTTCVYDNDTPNTVTFGESTDSEMCYNFTYAYPARSLVTFGLMSTACNN
jgi:mono/diheme cytochrome c family protein